MRDDVSAGARVVTVGAAPPAAALDADGAAVTAALEAAGAPVTARSFVEDDEATLESALAPAALTVIVAGPGGSSGDVVRRVLARLAGVRLVLSDRMLAALTEHYRRADRPLPRRAERLALLPQGVSVLASDRGEPGWALETASGTFVVLPAGGVAAPLATQLTALAAGLAGGRGPRIRTLKTAGIALADLEERLLDWLGREGPVTVTTMPTPGEVWVRLEAREGADLDAAERRLRAVLGEDCFGGDADTLERVVGRRLLDRGLTLSVAESCTGGLLGHRLTEIPGSSAYFERGVVVYSNRAKQELLGVPEAILREHGAVSGPTAEAMARGICERSGSACGLAITGVAGPDGGTTAKPVGTVFIGLAVPGAVSARRFRFDGDRSAVKWQSSQMALDMLRRGLGGPP
jgi:nicotinamide-nucleotide amidase